MKYYGTNLMTKGHYFWTAKGNELYDQKNNFEDYPFNPENLPIFKKNLPDGSMKFYFAFDYSILAIVGSCADDRPSSKTVFFIKEKLSFIDMLKKIKAIPIAIKIIKKMQSRFEIKEFNQKIITDTMRLDAIQIAAIGYGNGFVLRYSENGRGIRLHETTDENAVKDVREAIDIFIEKEVKDAREACENG